MEKTVRMFGKKADDEFELAAAVDICAATIALGKAARNYSLAEAGTPLEELPIEEGPIRVTLMRTDGRACDHVLALANFSPHIWGVVQLESFGQYDTTVDLVNLLRRLEGFGAVEAGSLLPSSDCAATGGARALINLATFRAMGARADNAVFQDKVAVRSSPSV